MEFQAPVILDKDGQLQDEGWLLERYGARVRHDFAAVSGQEYWRLAEIQETTGTVIIYVHTQHDSGPATEQPVVLHWPSEDGPPEDLLPRVNFASNWFPRGNVQRTNQNGDTAYAFGAGGIIRDLSIGGPYSVWIGSIAKSDLLTGVGWLGGTDHEGPFRLVFELVPVEMEYSTLDEALRETAKLYQVIQFNPDSALQKVIFRDGYVPNSPEYRLKFGETWYAVQRAERLGSADARVYFCKVDEWDRVEFTPALV